MTHHVPLSVRHEPPLGVNPVDIHGYEPPWKALSEFALQHGHHGGPLDRMDPGGPQFQHLVGQVRKKFVRRRFTNVHVYVPFV